MRPRLLRAVLVAGCAAGCAGELDTPGEPPIDSERRPLIGGEVPTPATDIDPAAVALTTPSKFSFCTGTLVSPRVVATAAHCIDMAAGDPNFTIFFGTDVASEGTRIGVMKAHPHPQWNGSLQNGRDIGLLLMNFRAPPEIEPVPLFTGDLNDHVGDPVRRVGFGIFDAVTRESDGRKRVGTTNITFVSQSRDFFYAGDPDLITCNGDSGGPALLEVDGVEVLAGVHSFGFGCTTPDNGDTRVDLYADDFITPWIQENDPTCRKDGFCARVGCVNDPDCEPCGPDGTCALDCPLPDVDCATQALGEICQGHTQCLSELCVDWRDDAGYRFCTRPCTPGADDCPAGMSCQNRVGYGDVCYHDEAPQGVLGDACEQHTDCGSYICEEGACVRECDLRVGITCPAGFSCAASQAGDDTFYCYRNAEQESAGGCGIAGAGGRGSLALVLALVLVALRRGRAAR